MALLNKRQLDEALMTTYPLLHENLELHVGTRGVDAEARHALWRFSRISCKR